MITLYTLLSHLTIIENSIISSEEIKELLNLRNPGNNLCSNFETKFKLLDSFFFYLLITTDVNFSLISEIPGCYIDASYDYSSKITTLKIRTPPQFEEVAKEKIGQCYENAIFVLKNYNKYLFKSSDEEMLKVIEFFKFKFEHKTVFIINKIPYKFSSLDIDKKMEEEYINIANNSFFLNNQNEICNLIAGRLNIDCNMLIGFDFKYNIEELIEKNDSITVIDYDNNSLKDKVIDEVLTKKNNESSIFNKFYNYIKSWFPWYNHTIENITNNSNEISQENDNEVKRSILGRVYDYVRSWFSLKKTNKNLRCYTSFDKTNNIINSPKVINKNIINNDEKMVCIENKDILYIE